MRSNRLGQPRYGSVCLSLVLSAVLVLAQLSGTALADSGAANAAAKAKAEAATQKEPAPLSDEELLQELGGDYEQAEAQAVADPLEPVNRVMFQVNDTLYVYLFRPVAKGYAAVLPSRVRTGIDGVFYNVRYPGRLVNNLLQARFSRALKETGRFLVNTLWGLGGFFEPADTIEPLRSAPPKKDTGMTLASWGIGKGFYIVWPVLGPSTLRTTVGSVGDRFMDPLTYTEPWYLSTSLSVEERINAISLRLGEYEELKKAALDPYSAFRNAFIQFREAQIAK